MTNHTHRYMDPETASLKGGRWVRRGMTWVWRNGENPSYLRGFERSAWENGTARTGASTPAGPNPHSLLENERG